MESILTAILGIILFFALVAIPLVFIISAISIFSVVVIGVPFAAVVLLIVFLVRKSKKKEQTSSEAGSTEQFNS